MTFIKFVTLAQVGAKTSLAPAKYTAQHGAQQLKHLFAENMHFGVDQPP